MRGIPRPTLYDINRTLTSSIIPAILPKTSSSLKRKVTLTEELIPLSSHPGYKFLDVKITPQVSHLSPPPSSSESPPPPRCQTSLESVDFTCDQWSTLLSTIDRMSQLGKYTERGLGLGSQTSSLASPPQLIKHLAASLTLYGPDSEEAIHSTSPPPATPSHSEPSQYPSSPSSLIETTPWARPSRELYHSPLSLNGYYRSCCLIANSQSILPSLTRPVQHGGRMFASGAYTHQYLSCGLELEEFVSSFRYLGQVIHNYRSLQ
jgi:hypothetical protein